jgi:hypothetical protein
MAGTHPGVALHPDFPTKRILKKHITQGISLEDYEKGSTDKLAIDMPAKRKRR